MEWFDTEELKNKENLSTEQVEYIKKPSLTIFGPFNIIIRKHWDLLVAFIAVGIIGEIIAESESLLLGLFFLAGYFWLIYFAIVNGRRLAWNRNNWKDFEHFKRSESTWMPWGIIVFVLFVLGILGGFFEGFLEGYMGY